MQRLLMSLLVLGLGVPIGRADDKPAAKADPAIQALESLAKEFGMVQQKFVEQVKASAEAARKSGAQPRPVSFDDGPAADFSPRFLALAVRDPRGPAAFQAIVLALRTSGGPTGKAGTWAKSMTLLKIHFATTPDIKPLIRPLGSVNDEDAESLLRAVIAKNPDRKLQALACRSLAEGGGKIVAMVHEINQNPELRRNFESVRGKEYVARLLANVGQRQKEADELKKTLREKYADLIVDVSIGKPAPEIAIQDLDGKEAKLSALKGKVVVLDIWATWCAPCRAMIPHEREMVERLKEKPFALISISTDEKKETLKEFLAQEKMPWTQWWNGRAGGVIEDWHVETLPTIYVIDAKGVIRHKDLRDEKLEEAVNDLLKEVRPDKAG